MIKQFYLTYQWTLTGTTNPGQRRSKSNGNEGVHDIPKISRTGASPSDAAEHHSHDAKNSGNQY